MLIAFVGPSLSGIRFLPGLEMHGPARRGDIRRALADGAKGIALIDGVFGDGPSVEHKEILLALDRGVPVIGASSMGALRAAECAAWGMEGVGSIFADYASGCRVADADVALLHGPETLEYCPLTVPLVDVDHFVEQLRPADRLQGQDLSPLRSVARTLHFRDRTWAAMLARMPLEVDEKQELAEAIRATFVSRKRLDAIEACIRLRSLSDPTATLGSS